MDTKSVAGSSFKTNEIPPFIKVKWDSGEEDVHYAFVYDGTPEELRLRYEKELNETQENRQNGLSRLKKIIINEQFENLNDDILLAVLRSTKFNFKKSESKLREFIVFRRQLVKQLTMIDIDEYLKKFSDFTTWGFLPYRDKHGRAVFYGRTYGLDLDKYSVKEALLIAYVGLLFSFSLELSTTAGFVYIMDTKTPSIKTTFQLFHVLQKFSLKALSFPYRLGKVEVLNEFSLIRKMFQVIRHVLPDKIVKRVTFNGPCENLIKSYHPDIIPEEFGGNLGKLNNDFFKQQLLDFVADLRKEAKSKPSY